MLPPIASTRTVHSKPNFVGFFIAIYTKQIKVEPRQRPQTTVIELVVYFFWLIRRKQLITCDIQQVTYSLILVHKQ